MPALPIEQFLNLKKKYPVIDVRSPGEYAHGHIPGAINIPLFSDDERAEVGSSYKKQGRDAAISKGLEIAGPKLADFVKITRKIAKKGPLLLHCWRGGMRSNSMAWLFNTAGIETHTLDGGYKSYRRSVQAVFELPYKLLLIGGETGSGKTKVLQEIEKLGEQVIDIEKLARHKGSAFGMLGEEPQPTVEQFENDLAEAFLQLDKEIRIWVEDESHSIGKVYLPLPLWNLMKKAPILRITLPKQVRVQRLLVDYGGFDQEILVEKIQKISKRLGGQHAKSAIEALNSGDTATAIEIVLTYYDKAYDLNHQKREFKGVHFLKFEVDDVPSIASAVLEVGMQLELKGEVNVGS